MLREVQQEIFETQERERVKQESVKQEHLAMQANLAALKHNVAVVASPSKRAANDQVVGLTATPTAAAATPSPKKPKVGGAALDAALLVGIS